MTNLSKGDKVTVDRANIIGGVGHGYVTDVSNIGATVKFFGGSVGKYPLSDVKKHEPNGTPYHGMASQSNGGNM